MEGGGGRGGRGGGAAVCYACRVQEFESLLLLLSRVSVASVKWCNLVMLSSRLALQSLCPTLIVELGEGRGACRGGGGEGGVAAVCMSSAGFESLLLLL